jgi:pimeloyl-ACP methyl ester carboxylesterase
MTEFKHQYLSVNNTRIHAVEAGRGPLVLLIHGFPELWHSWRYQLQFLAENGFRAVAFDQRGYGRSSKFWNPDVYRIHRLVDDVVGIIDALGEDTAVVVGHDWGAPVAWTAAWCHPQRFRGVMGMAVPFSGRQLIALPGNPFGEHDLSPNAYHAQLAGPGQDFYHGYFGTMGPAIDEFEADVSGWLRDVFLSLSGAEIIKSGFDAEAAMSDPGSYVRNSSACVPHGSGIRDRTVSSGEMPNWFTEDDLDFYVSEYLGSGLAGPLSYYRNIDASWHDLAEQAEKPLTVPAFFLGGELDVATFWGAEAIARAPEKMTHWMGCRILEGCGHWIQQERPGETNTALLDFLQALPDK